MPLIEEDMRLNGGMEYHAAESEIASQRRYCVS